ncbi:P1 family peptidase [Kribbella sp. VKM Ac-2568]|uniref:P1 family peptidase n=1 Tax=Kribbella sp. VKM Ac-2568 TaxID=2512219 RepID=UPI00104EF504|nr:P1 family peptidase [Kribbella sp. VKM Ac-2568]TCM40201.1 putative pantetheine hydrolase [Kribbella sp. VKM Ac-2568]
MTTELPVPGPHNAITDVPGVLVGQIERTDAPYLTGTTVVHVPAGAVAGVDVRGGAPGTRETDLLDPVNSNPGANAIVLTGGSAFGLDAVAGAMSWLEDRGQGVRVGPFENDVVPIVPAAVIFDLGRGGAFQARPDRGWALAAIEAASKDPVAQGNYGAGAGARVGGLKGGVGSASVRLPDGTTVGALVIVNAVGSAVDSQGRLYAERYGLPGEFPVLRTPVEPPPAPPGSAPGMNTVIAVVATDAPLDKAAVKRMAMVAHDGLARAIDPVHTLLDGDTIFALSTGNPPPKPRPAPDQPSAEQAPAAEAPAGEALAGEAPAAQALASAEAASASAVTTTAGPSAPAPASASGVPAVPDVPAVLRVTDQGALLLLEGVFAAGASTLARAVGHAVLAAESVETPEGRLPSYRDAYPSAFSNG